MDAIVAYDKNRAIGQSNELLWAKGTQKADMLRFRSLTLRRTVIMGRKTFESIGGLLADRDNVVISRTFTDTEGGAKVYSNIEDVVNVYRDQPGSIVIGGAAVYAAMLPDVDRVYVTEIDNMFEGADAYFPELTEDQWTLSKEQAFARDDDNRFGYRFLQYDRI